MAETAAKNVSLATAKSRSRGVRARENHCDACALGTMGERLHALILRSAPALQPAPRYGMPGYAKDGKTVCFFRADKKYLTFGYTQDANVTIEKDAPHQLAESAWYLQRAERQQSQGSPPSCAR